MVKKTLIRLEQEPLPPILFIHGSERVWQDRIYSVLEKRQAQDPLAQWNWKVLRGSEDFVLDPLLEELFLLPWGAGPKLVVLKDAQRIAAPILSKLTEWLIDQEQINHLAIFFVKLDKRLKFAKTLREIAWEIECAPLEGESLLRYVLDSALEQGRKMERSAVEVFLERVDHDLLIVEQEIAKLINWSEGRANITRADVETVTSLYPKQILNHAVFQMTDLIAQKKRREALVVLDSLLGAGEAPLRLLPVIERQLRLLLAAKTGEGKLSDIARQMGEKNSYALGKVKPFANNFNLEEIFAGFRAVVKADRAIKLGTPGEQVLTDLILQLTA